MRGSSFLMSRESILDYFEVYIIENTLVDCISRNDML